MLQNQVTTVGQQVEEFFLSVPKTPNLILAYYRPFSSSGGQPIIARQPSRLGVLAHRYHALAAVLFPLDLGDVDPRSPLLPCHAFPRFLHVTLPFRRCGPNPERLGSSRDARRHTANEEDVR